MTRAATLVAILLLAGCAGRGGTPPPVVHIPVPCKSPAVDAPLLAYTDALRAAPLDDQVLALAIDRESLLAYAIELGAALEACRK